jgi:acetyl esterase/lipase
MRCVLPFSWLAAAIVAAWSGQGASLASGQVAGPIKVAAEQVVYQRVEGLDLTLDLYLPQDGKPGRPAVVWIHGGGFSGGKPSQFQPQSEHLASFGVVCATVRYRLTGEAAFPACIEDAKAAVRFFRAHAAEYGVDPDRIAVGGGSAGGHLAAMIGLTPGQFEGEGPNRETSSRANLLILFNPALDLRELGKAAQRRPRAGGALPSEADLARFSPITHVSADAPPTLVLHGQSDATVPFRQAVALRDALRAKQVRVELFTAEGKGHGWFNRPPDLEITTRRVIQFLKENGFWPESGPGEQQPGSPRPVEPRL